MSELMLDHVRNMVARVSQDMRQMGDVNQQSLDTILNALNDLAGNVLALEAVVGAMLKKYPVEAGEAKDWLKDHLAPTGGEAPVAEGLIDYMVTGKRE